MAISFIWHWNDLETSASSAVVCKLQMRRYYHYHYYYYYVCRDINPETRLTCCQPGRWPYSLQEFDFFKCLCSRIGRLPLQTVVFLFFFYVNNIRKDRAFSFPRGVWRIKTDRKKRNGRLPRRKLAVKVRKFKFKVQNCSSSDAHKNRYCTSHRTNNGVAHFQLSTIFQVI